MNSSSTDQTQDVLANLKARFPLRSITIPNQGKAAARNQGVEEAISDIILITDADMLPDSGLIAAHVEAHEATNHGPVCYEGLTYNLESLDKPLSEQKLSPIITRPYPAGKKLGWYYFLTGNISFPKSLFIAAKGFSTDFTGYGWEDLELGYRLKQNKIPLIYLKSAMNYHLHIVPKDNELIRSVDKGRSAKVMIAKHPELRMFMGLNPLSTLVFRLTSPTSILYRFFQNRYQKGPGKALGYWFLKEYHYVEGLLS